MPYFSAEKVLTINQLYSKYYIRHSESGNKQDWVLLRNLHAIWILKRKNLKRSNTYYDGLFRVVGGGLFVKVAGYHGENSGVPLTWKTTNISFSEPTSVQRSVGPAGSKPRGCPGSPSAGRRSTPRGGGAGGERAPKVCPAFCKLSQLPGGKHYSGIHLAPHWQLPRWRLRSPLPDDRLSIDSACAELDWHRLRGGAADAVAATRTVLEEGPGLGLPWARGALDLTSRCGFCPSFAHFPPKRAGRGQ